eukprot:CAMPEP_0172718838 /NCGR_PEP_ID=MMETSP1074-20121228/75156_1 /TAXON_ID=2916 /ORGANISM="Ceratium fusus, Strain PA161109" /LENGTH=70 /DNA_ID=CAMNT_0013544117 /DNA_START=265 /DNA_END=478 /DNA_ORIENTATION=-
MASGRPMPFCSMAAIMAALCTALRPRLGSIAVTKAMSIAMASTMACAFALLESACSTSAWVTSAIFLKIL